MLTLSSKSTYALRALMELAGNHGNKLLQIKDIAERQRIPRNYLEQILNILTKREIIHGVRGKDGGYALADHPDSMTVLQVLEAVDGPIHLSDSNEVTAIKTLYNSAEQKIREAFSVSLSELCEQQRSIETPINFQI